MSLGEKALPGTVRETGLINRGWNGILDRGSNESTFWAGKLFRYDNTFRSR